MKKLFSVVLVALFVLGLTGVASAAYFASDNAGILGPTGGRTGVSPEVQVVRVRYGLYVPSAQDANGNISSGDVLVWDTTSADGITISRCITDAPSDTVKFAGVAVCDITTADGVSVRGNERNWGWMAVQGFCLAKCDTDQVATGEGLALGGATLNGAFQTSPEGVTRALCSEDIGVLLTDTGADGLMKVWLN